VKEKELTYDDWTIEWWRWIEKKSQGQRERERKGVGGVVDFCVGTKV
jgi:hypothetical protein